MYTHKMYTNKMYTTYKMYSTQYIPSSLRPFPALPATSTCSAKRNLNNVSSHVYDGNKARVAATGDAVRLAPVGQGRVTSTLCEKVGLRFGRGHHAPPNKSSGQEHAIKILRQNNTIYGIYHARCRARELKLCSTQNTCKHFVITEEQSRKYKGTIARGVNQCDAP